MQTIINMLVKFSGFGWVWAKVDGAKTFIAGTTAILTGLAGLLQELSVPLEAHNAGGLWAVIKHLPTDNCWLLLIGGFGTIGLRHAIAKANA